MSAPPRRCPGDLLVHLRRARDHADRHYAEPLDLEALAAVAGISKYHFQRLFTATYGVSPAAHLSRRRVERAQDLLRATNLTVTEVCHAVGFSSLGSFSQPVPGAGRGDPERVPASLGRDRRAAHPGLLRVHVGPGRAARLRNPGEAGAGRRS